MTYQQTLDYMMSALPMYHRIGAAAYKADIQPTIDMLDALGNPHHHFRSLHIAGTNGKGSVSSWLASVLQEAGYKVGLYTSPHLVDFRERIRINGQMIQPEAVTTFVEENRSLFEQLHLSFFEMTVGLAFHHFAQQHVDVAVVEVGMGGRLDSTNVITPDLSIITNIGLEHTQFLGDTLPKIATEKGGIIKQGIPVVVGETHPETAPVFTQLAVTHNAPISFADQCWQVQPLAGDDQQGILHFDLLPTPPTTRTPLHSLTSPLAGDYQRHNLATLMEALCQLRERGLYHITDQHIADGIANVKQNTHFGGRWEVIGHHPLTICETAHNADGIRAMSAKLRTMGHKHIHLVYGCVSDKDYTSILQYLQDQLLQAGITPTWYFTAPTVPRRLPADQLHAAATALGIHGQQHPHVADAIQAARTAATGDDLVLITGSIFLVADALASSKRSL